MVKKFASKEEYTEDMNNCAKEKMILNSFLRAIKVQDSDKAEESLQILQSFSHDLEFKTAKLDNVTMEYTTRPWIARVLDEKYLMMNEKNENMHKNLAKFFDIAVDQNMKIDGMIDDFNRAASGTNFPNRKPKFSHSLRYDGNEEIAYWLKEYAKTANVFEKQGKKIIEPETFKNILV